jgi:hypothetical protein
VSHPTVAKARSQLGGNNLPPERTVADRSGEVWIAAEIKINTELAKMPRAKGVAIKDRNIGPRIEPVIGRRHLKSLASRIASASRELISSRSSGPLSESRSSKN